MTKRIEFFETKIRPVLVEACYECHNSLDTAEGELAVDYRDGLLGGGTGGGLIAPGDPAASRLMAILRHEVEGLEMPQGGAKLDAEVLADFESWIRSGAIDPRDEPPTADEYAESMSWDSVLQRRKQWWSFQPIASGEPPESIQTASSHPIDRFLDHKLEQLGLAASPRADARVLVRRVYFNLIGLSPSIDELEQWSKRLDESSEERRSIVWKELVDHLLESPRFGERWARHWMDWIRYAESHGSEGDPAIENAWMYRDYLIRAHNADVPYDQLLREHVAGDLISNPRINHELGLNESAIGPAHLRMVFHGFAPTDALDEKARFIDDQVNALSKAFLGITVACARCHDHKFDAISQKDYYAMFGILAACRPGRTVVDVPERLELHRDQLVELKQSIRTTLGEEWLVAVDGLAEKLQAENTKAGDAKAGDAKAERNAVGLLAPWQQMVERVGKGEDFSAAWAEVIGSIRPKVKASQSDATGAIVWQSRLSRDGDYSEWNAVGTGLEFGPAPPGEFALAPSGDAVLVGIYPAGVYSHLVSQKHAARLSSRDIPLDGECELWLRVVGGSGASSRYVVHDYPRNGTVYPVNDLPGKWTWQQYDLSYWKGDQVHVELTTALDAPLLVKNQPRSWIGIREAILKQKGSGPPDDRDELLELILEAGSRGNPTSFASLAEVYESAVREAIVAWKEGGITDCQALLLDACARLGWLPNTIEKLPKAAERLALYRQLEEEIPVPVRVPGLDQTVGRVQPLYERGHHRQPRDVVPRRFLEAIDAKPYADDEASRLALARDLVREDNPLTRRVIVNRLWHHLFGRGIVATPDNLGRLGEPPSHPELLDWLTNRFVQDGWSMKRMIGLIVTSEAWQRSSSPSPDAEEKDPENRFLAHAHVRRMEAEAIRDALLSFGDGLDHQMGGRPVDGEARRRSVYVGVVRNRLDPFLRVFDFPEPFSSVGRRDVTNVPAQSLTMLNDPRMQVHASRWAAHVLADKRLVSDVDRVQQMFLGSLGRDASDAELDQVLEFLAATRQRLSDDERVRFELTAQMATRRRSIESVIEAIRKEMPNQGEHRPENAESVTLARPIASWSFDGGGDDSVGSLDVQLHGDASIVDGALVVRSEGHAVSPPLPMTLAEKTLEAWVQLARWDQAGAGVMTVQSRDGGTFDAIVFGEQQPRHWLAGSNFFARTQSFGGTAESDAITRPVHVAIVYHRDGRVVAYRDGKPYGKAYQSAGPASFSEGQAVVAFGVRHFPPGGNRMLSGRIAHANLYDRAITDEELASSAKASGHSVSETEWIAKLPIEDQQQVARWKAEVKRFELERESLGAEVSADDPRVVWTELARAMFTLSELIYVR